MQIPLNVCFVGTGSSENIKNYVTEQVKKIEAHAPRLMGCTAIVRSIHQKHNPNKHFSAHIVLRFPHREIAVSHDNPLKNTSAYTAIHQAFRAAFRQLDVLKKPYLTSKVKQKELNVKQTLDINSG